MKTEENVEIKAKGVVVATKDYTFPESLEEGLTVDGEDKVYKLYAQQRKIRWADAERKIATGGGIPKDIMQALKSLDVNVLRDALKKVGIELDDIK